MVHFTHIQSIQTSIKQLPRWYDSIFSLANDRIATPKINEEPPQYIRVVILPTQGKEKEHPYFHPENKNEKLIKQRPFLNRR